MQNRNKVSATSVPKTVKKIAKKSVISKKSEHREGMTFYNNMIMGPNGTSILLHYRKDQFSFLDIGTGISTDLPHDQMQVATKIDDQIFASAGNFSVRIWNFDNLKLVNEHEVVSRKHEYSGDIVTRDMQFLPKHRSLVGFTSTGYLRNTREKTFSWLWVLNVDTGNKLSFDTTSLGKLIHYKIAIIPNEFNKFIIYDEVNGKNILIFEIDFKLKKLTLIASHENLNLGGFYKIAISPDGQYWAAEMRFFGKPMVGTQVYKVDKHYNLKCIAKLFNAKKPQWTGSKLLYSLNNSICEFNPKKLSHSILSESLPGEARILPSAGPEFFQVARENEWEIYQYYPKNYAKKWDKEVERCSPLIPPLRDIVGEYLEIKSISENSFVPRPLKIFGKNTLFKIPSEKGLVKMDPEKASLEMKATYK